MCSASVTMTVVISHLSVILGRLVGHCQGNTLLLSAPTVAWDSVVLYRTSECDCGKLCLLASCLLSVNCKLFTVSSNVNWNTIKPYVGLHCRPRPGN